MADEVICDPIGFSNHEGECWNDAIQEILLFADGIKEITQPLLHSLHSSEIPARVAAVQEDLLIPAVAEYAEYIRLMQSRFQMHVAYLQAANRGAMAEQKRRMSATCGINAAAKMALAIKGTKEMGLCDEDRNKVFTDLCRIFGAPFVVALFKQGTTMGGHVAYLFSGIGYDSETLTSIGGHAIAALQCGGQWYFYDDNEGVRPISPRVLELCLAEEEFGFFYDSGILTFVKVQRTQQSPTKSRNNSRTPTQFVKEGGIAIRVTERLEGDVWKPFAFEEAHTNRVYGIKTEKGVYGIRRRQSVREILAAKKSRKMLRRKSRRNIRRRQMAHAQG